jgi:hypothetical protein
MCVDDRHASPDWFVFGSGYSLSQSHAARGNCAANKEISSVHGLSSNEATQSFDMKVAAMIVVRMRTDCNLYGLFLDAPFKP